MSDERLKRNTDPTQSRAMDTRAITESRVLSDEERIRAYRMEKHKSQLPDLPLIDGWHTCWLTTTNPQDPIHRRVEMGYEPIKPEDVAGWNHSTQKSGEFAGCISVNEMLAFKLPMSLYEAYMKHSHHDEPNEQAYAIYENAMDQNEEARNQNSNIEVGDGISELRRSGEAHLVKPRFELA
jgi:hypothetical protein